MPTTRSRNRQSAKKAGTAWESAVVAYLKEKGFEDAERLPKFGSKDQGDVRAFRGGPTLECKDTSSYSLASWVAEAEVESVNAGTVFGATWAKRKGKSSPSEGYVICKGSAFVKLLLMLRELNS